MTDIQFDTVHRTVGLTANAPAIFARGDFMAWLNAPANRVLSYHLKGESAGEYSDVVVLVDANYEGDASDMPEDIWKAICDLAYAQYGGERIPLAGGSHVHVRITNLEV